MRLVFFPHAYPIPEVSGPYSLASLIMKKYLYKNRLKLLFPALQPLICVIWFVPGPSQRKGIHGSGFYRLQIDGENIGFFLIQRLYPVFCHNGAVRGYIHDLAA